MAILLRRAESRDLWGLHNLKLSFVEAVFSLQMEAGSSTADAAVMSRLSPIPTSGPCQALVLSANAFQDTVHICKNARQLHCPSSCLLWQRLTRVILKFGVAQERTLVFMGPVWNKTILKL